MATGKTHPILFHCKKECFHFAQEWNIFDNAQEYYHWKSKHITSNCKRFISVNITWVHVYHLSLFLMSALNSSTESIASTSSRSCLMLKLSFKNFQDIWLKVFELEFWRFIFIHCLELLRKLLWVVKAYLIHFNN